MSLFENALGSCGVCVGWLLGSRQVNFFSAPRIFADMTITRFFARMFLIIRLHNSIRRNCSCAYLLSSYFENAVTNLDTW